MRRPFANGGLCPRHGEGEGKWRGQSLNGAGREGGNFQPRTELGGLLLDGWSEAAVAGDVRKDLERVEHRIARAQERAYVGASDQVPVPGADAEAAQGLQPLVRELAGDRQSEEVPAKAGEASVWIGRPCTVHAGDLNHSPVDGGKRAALF